MMGKTHLCIGTGITLSIAASTNIPITLPLVMVTVVGSLMPDIDEQNSLIVSRTLPKPFLDVLRILFVILATATYFANLVPAPWNVIVTLAIAGLAFFPIRVLRKISLILIGLAFMIGGHTLGSWATIGGACLLICALVKHRGLTHTLYGLSAWCALLYFVTYQTSGHLVWLAGGAAYGLHLFADALTDRGIQPFPPFKYRLRLKLMSTGTLRGSIIEGACIMITLALVVVVFLMK